MHKTVLFFCLFLIISCRSKIDEEQIQLLNGYWEIEEVIFSDGMKKEYKMNSTVDYIQVDALEGFRKKVNPKFNGTFETSDDAEPFTIMVEEDSTYIRYNTGLDAWSETITKISNSSFSVKNQNGIIYTYKRFEPINITD